MKITITHGPVEKTGTLTVEQAEAFYRMVDKFGYVDAKNLSTNNEQASHMIDSLNEVKELIVCDHGKFHTWP
ncbi:hypothetical protein ACU6U9_02590 [Pseudomonas sp. HK3]|jgi:hypothetical protein